MKRHLKKPRNADAMTKTPLGRVPRDYREFLEDLKSRIRSAQMRAALAVNRELVQLYWSIGRDIVIRQDREHWGSGVIDRLSADIQAAFPGIEGFSSSNISRMRAFYLAWAEPAEISAQAVPKANKRNSAQAVPKLGSTVPPGTVMQLPWAEYALRHLQRPVGVARYITKLTETLPSELAGKLPSIEEIEAELAKPSRRGGGRAQSNHRGKLSRTRSKSRAR
jgi:hypothetical protein